MYKKAKSMFLMYVLIVCSIALFLCGVFCIKTEDNADSGVDEINISLTVDCQNADGNTGYWKYITQGVRAITYGGHEYCYQTIDGNNPYSGRYLHASLNNFHLQASIENKVHYEGFNAYLDCNSKSNSDSQGRKFGVIAEWGTAKITYTYDSSRFEICGGSFSSSGRGFSDSGELASGSTCSIWAEGIKPASVSYSVTFRPKETTVTFKQQLGQKSATNIETGKYRYTTKLTSDQVSAPATVNGYTFKGWYDSAGNYLTKERNLLVYDMGAQFIAKYDPNVYTVTFDSQGGSGGTSTTKETYDSVIEAIEPPTKAGYTFQGYYTSTGGEGTKYYNANGSGNGNWQTAGNTTLYAYWTKNNYHVDVNILNPAGSQDYVSGTMTQKYGSEIKNGLTDQHFAYIKYNETWEIYNIVPKTGYYLERVYSNIGNISKSGNKYIYKADMGTYSGENWDDFITIQMKWVNYKVKFNPGGGDGTMPDQSFVYNESKPLTKNKFTKDGYTFAGWSGGYSDGQTVSGLSATNGGVITLTAQWRPKIYKVTLDNQGATTAGTTGYWYKYKYYTGSTYYYKDANCSTPMSNSIIKPTKIGYIFGGYYTSIGGQGTCYIKENGDCINSIYQHLGNITLYAKWTAKTYNINYHANGGKGSARGSATYNSPFTLRDGSGFSKTGYTFSHWSITSDGSNTGWNNYIGKPWTWTYDYGLTFYAQWTPNSYTIKFKGNGVTEGIMNDQSCIYDKSQTLFTNSFIRAGYYFAGWSTSENGSVVYKDKEVVSNLTTTAKDNVNLYAVWSGTIAQKGQKPELDSHGNWLIKNAENLAYLISNHETGYYKQENDIDLSGEIWYPIGTPENPFKGSYNGQGYVIKNLTIPNITDVNNDNINSNIGLFGYIDATNSNRNINSDGNNGLIKNVYINNAIITGNSNVGVLVGNGKNAKVKNCMIESSTINTSGTYGVIIASSKENSIIENCFVSVTIPGDKQSDFSKVLCPTSNVSIDKCLVEKNGVKDKIGEDFSGWAKIGNKLIPSKDWAWVLLVQGNELTANDLNKYNR